MKPKPKANSQVPDYSKIDQSKMSLTEAQYVKLEADIKKVKYPTHAISNAQALSEKIGSFKNAKVRKELADRLKDYNSYRQVRGDGNCFFRAVAFSYFSAIAEPSVKNCFSMLDQVSLTCCFPETVYRHFRDFYCNKFLRMVLEKNWEIAYRQCLKQSGGIILKALLKLFTDYPYLDFIVVLYFRSLCLKALWNFQKQGKDFLDGTEEKTIRSYSQQSQGIVIHLCSGMLQIKIFVFEVRKDQIQSYEYTDIAKPIAAIYLLYYENHYDIIQKNQNIQAQGSVVSEEDYYSVINERMIEGVCIECAITGMIYEDSGLCLKCRQDSLSTFNQFSKEKEKYMRGKCNQCYRTKDQVSMQLGLCKDCIQLQGQIQAKKQKQNLLSKTKTECLNCKYEQFVYMDTGLCKYCTREQERIPQNYFEKKDEKRSTNVINPTKKYGYCDDCNYKTDIYVQSNLCRECEHKRMVKTVPADKNPKISELKNKNQTPYCKKCHNPKFNHETNLCSTCEKISSSKISASKISSPTIPKYYKCKECGRQFHKQFFKVDEDLCLNCKKYEKPHCKKCKKPFTELALIDGACSQCRWKSTLY